jgi:hypothetical protein
MERSLQMSQWYEVNVVGASCPLSHLIITCPTGRDKQTRFWQQCWARNDRRGVGVSGSPPDGVSSNHIQWERW